MKQMVSIFLILLLGMQCLEKLGLLTIYQINKEYIGNTLCENKAKPEMQCEGRCFLKKRVADAEKREKEAAGIEKQLEIPLFLIVLSAELSISPTSICKGNTPLIIDYSYIVSNYIFHPPTLNIA